MTRPNRNSVAMILALMLGFTAVARAQIEEDWAVFTDDATDTVCDIVNGSNAEFVVLFDTGEIVTVAGRFTGSVVDFDDLSVTFDGAPAGFLDFRTDGDGLRTLFWLTLTESVVGINALNAEPFDSGLSPASRTNTGCDACEVIVSSLCDDDGNGGDNGDGGFTPIFICGAGANEGALVAALMLPIVGRLRRRK